MPGAEKQAVTVRLEPAKRAELDAVAQSIDRDRSYAINEAIDAYLDVHRWQVAKIEKGLRQADAGEFVSDAEIEAILARYR